MPLGSPCSSGCGEDNPLPERHGPACYCWVYPQFDNSSVKETSLHASQEAMDLPVIKFKLPKDVWCLLYDGAVKASLKCYPAVILELERQ